MGFFSAIGDFLSEPVAGLIGSVAMGLLGEKARQIAMNSSWR